MALHVILVEDDDRLRHAFEEVLEHAGYIVHPFASYRGVTELIDLGSQADLLLVDVVLPDGTPQGPSVAAMARFRRPKLPVLFMTGYQEHADLIRKWDVVLLKPVRHEVLLQAVADSQMVANSGRSPTVKK